MVNKEEQFIYQFETGKQYPQEFFNEIIKTALSYRYKDATSIPLVSGKDVTDAIFHLSDKDNLKLFHQKVNGQRIIELFITSIYLKYLDACYQDKIIIIGIPFTEESYDVVVYVAEKENCIPMEDRSRLKLSKHLDAYHIQIKEEFDYNASTNDYQTLKSTLDVSSLKEKSARYSELVLIFMRDYFVFDSTHLGSFLEDNKNVGLISMPSLDPKEITITDGKDKDKVITLEEGKYNFLLNTDNKVMHIKYDVPTFLIAKT